MSITAYGTRLIEQLANSGICDERVLDAMARIPRHHFVDAGLAARAWENTALPIGQGQTISQPYIVAKMTELLLQDINQGPVLEIGTGSGYQTAILALLVADLYTVERLKPLQILARTRLKRLDLHNVAFRCGDGWHGWASQGPFAGIMVTAAASCVPDALVEQLAEGGCLVIPVGEDHQRLRVIDKINGQILSRDEESVRFVPLVKETPG